eukprot:Gb_03231 [translate_table: standard]
MASSVSESQRTLQLLEEPFEEKPTSSASVQPHQHNDTQEPSKINVESKHNNKDNNNSTSTMVQDTVKPFPSRQDSAQSQENSNHEEPINVKPGEERLASSPLSQASVQLQGNHSNQEELISNSKTLGSPSVQSQEQGTADEHMNNTSKSVQEGLLPSPSLVQPQDHSNWQKSVSSSKAVHERLIAPPLPPSQGSPQLQGNHGGIDPPRCLRSRFPIPAYPAASGVGAYVVSAERKEDGTPPRGLNSGREGGSATFLPREQVRFASVQENSNRQEPLSIPRAVYERFMATPFRQGYVQLQDSINNLRPLQTLNDASQQWVRSHVINVEELMQSPNAVRPPNQTNETKKRKEREVTKVQKEELWPNPAVDALLRKFEDLCFNKHRGQLGKKHWDRIAAAVNAICGTDYTGMQCKYKWHRLKKMYNKEKQRSEPSKWAFYRHVEHIVQKASKSAGIQNDLQNDSNEEECANDVDTTCDAASNESNQEEPSIQTKSASPLNGIRDEDKRPKKKRVPLKSFGQKMERSMTQLAHTVSNIEKTRTEEIKKLLDTQLQIASIMVQGMKEFKQGAGGTGCNDQGVRERELLPPQQEGYNERFVPPLNFAMVDKRVYRSGLPNNKNFPFLETLQLSSIM